MWQLTNLSVALLLAVTLHAQTREATDSGVFVADRSGRYVRLEGRDGVVVEYLYATPGATETSGFAVHVNGRLTLTVKSAGPGELAVEGLPPLTSVFDAGGRTTAVLADGMALARLTYRDDLFASIAVPGHFTWNCSPPDRWYRVQQVVRSASGQVVAKALVTAGGAASRDAYHIAAEDLGIDPDAVTYQQSPTGALTTARDGNGRVAFYIVHTDAGDVGFSPDGRPRFYDLALSVLGGTIAPGSDVLTPDASEGQRGAIPDRLILAVRGAVGIYAQEPANGAIDAAWADSSGKLFSRQSPATSAVIRQPLGVR